MPPEVEQSSCDEGRACNLTTGSAYLASQLPRTLRFWGGFWSRPKQRRFFGWGPFELASLLCLHPCSWSCDADAIPIPKGTRLARHVPPFLATLGVGAPAIGIRFHIAGRSVPLQRLHVPETRGGASATRNPSLGSVVMQSSYTHSPDCLASRDFFVRGRRSMPSDNDTSLR